MPDNKLTCPPGWIPVTTPDGIEACASNLKPIFCDPPGVVVCDPAVPSVCMCRVPLAAMACEVRIQYAQGAPEAPIVVAQPAAYCDGAGVAVALTAAALAQLLSAPK